MPIYYRGPCARITHEVIEVWCPTYQSYALHDLDGAWIETMGSPVITPLGAGSAGIASAVAVILTLEQSAGWHAFDSPISILAAVAIFVASVIVSWACWRAREVDQRIVGVYRGIEVILYYDADRQRFAQVARALGRALEQAEDAR
jgi:hypothetical protein